MKRFRILCLILIILFSVAGCDRATKIVAKKYLSMSPPITYFGDLVVLDYVENKGAFLSFGSNFSDQARFWLFILIPSLFLFGFLSYMIITDKLTYFQIIAFSILIGGGIGNLYDRIFSFGQVIDFINIGIGSIRTGIFNIADLAVMIGSCMLVLPFVITFIKPKKRDLI
jgi:signal peptidase II